MSVTSVNQSGRFYFKLGFTALKENISDQLYYSDGNTDGGIMFLTNSAIAAWMEKVKEQTILNPELSFFTLK